MSMRLRQLRHESGMTLETLAERAGLTKSYLSKVERGNSTPSISLAIKIATVLGVDVETLFGEQDDTDQIMVVRAGERTKIVSDPTGKQSSYEGIATSVGGKQMLPFLLYPQASGERPPFREHVGEEFVFVHQGKVLLEFPDESYELSVGDSAYFQGRIPHRVHAAGKRSPALLIVISNGEPGGKFPTHV